MNWISQWSKTSSLCVTLGPYRLVMNWHLVLFSVAISCRLYQKSSNYVTLNTLWTRNIVSSSYLQIWWIWSHIKLGYFEVCPRVIYKPRQLGLLQDLLTSLMFQGWAEWATYFDYEDLVSHHSSPEYSEWMFTRPIETYWNLLSRSNSSRLSHGSRSLSHPEMMQQGLRVPRSHGWYR